MEVERPQRADAETEAALERDPVHALLKSAETAAAAISSGFRRVESYLAIARSCAKLDLSPIGSIEAAKSAAKESRKIYPKFGEREFIDIVETEAELGLIEAANDTAELIEDKGERASAYFGIAAEARKAGMDASRMLAKAEELAAEYIAEKAHEIERGDCCDTGGLRGYNDIVLAKAKMGKFAEAEQLAKEFGCADCREVMLDKAARVGDDPRRFERLKENARTHSDPVKRAAAYLEIAVEEARSGVDPSDALNIVRGIAEQMERGGRQEKIYQKLARASVEAAEAFAAADREAAAP